MTSKSLASVFKKPATLLSALLPLALLLAACQAAVIPPQAPAVTSAPPATEAPPAPPATAAPAEAVINIATDPKLGQILVGDKGMTLYIFTKDEPNKSNCSGKCLDNWPPLLTQGKPVLGDGVDASLVGTAAMADGSMIVTYNKLPLYYWTKDTKPGDTTGQGNNKVWYVISPDGKPVGK